MDLALCTGAQSCWNRKWSSPDCSHNVGSIPLSKMSQYAETLRFPLTGSKRPSLTPEKTALAHYLSSIKLYSWHNAVRQVMFFWHPPNPDLPICLPNREAWFITSQNRFPLLQSPVSMCFNPLCLGMLDFCPDFCFDLKSVCFNANCVRVRES